jgi:hypothetical protein
MAGQHDSDASSYSRSRSHPTREPSNRSAGEAEDGATREAAGGPSDQTAQQAADDRVRRAEELVDRIGVRVGEITASLGHQLLRLGARVREEAEDIWAEAQSLRRRQ